MASNFFSNISLDKAAPGEPPLQEEEDLPDYSEAPVSLEFLSALSDLESALARLSGTAGGQMRPRCRSWVN